MALNEFWRGRRVIITGASSGLGAALAEHVAARGARVGLIARRASLLDSLASKIRAGGGTAASAAADVGNAEELKQSIEQTERQIGTCDVMVANAGVLRQTPGGAFDAAVVDEVIRTNVLGVANAFAAVLPRMVAQRSGHLAAVASIASLLGLPSVGAYCASKSAVVTLMESLAVDLHRFGIRTTTICPGFIDTPLLSEPEKARVGKMMTAQTAAARTARAIERGQRECWFPGGTVAAAWIGKHLPHALYRRLMAGRQ